MPTSELDSTAKNTLRLALVRAIADAEQYAARLSADLVAIDASADRIRDALARTAGTRATLPSSMATILANQTEQTLLTLCANRLAYRRYLAEVHDVIQKHRASMAELTADSN